jgi:hypothetical protein
VAGLDVDAVVTVAGVVAEVVAAVARMRRRSGAYSVARSSSHSNL